MAADLRAGKPISPPLSALSFFLFYSTFPIQTSASELKRRKENIEVDARQ
jgi:hypothetical protein